jgi:hypothetical protein
LVAVSLTAVLVAALPALQELGRAARSIEKLADTLRRELPPTLEAIRLTGLEISDLTDDVSEGVKSAGQVVKQVDQSLSGAKNQAKKVQVNTRGVVAGVKAAWKTWRRPSTGRRSIDRLPPSQRMPLELREHETGCPEWLNPHQQGMPIESEMPTIRMPILAIAKHLIRTPRMILFHQGNTMTWNRLTKAQNIKLVCI